MKKVLGQSEKLTHSFTGVASAAKGIGVAMGIMGVAGVGAGGPACVLPARWPARLTARAVSGLLRDDGRVGDRSMAEAIRDGGRADNH